MYLKVLYMLVCYLKLAAYFLPVWYFYLFQNKVDSKMKQSNCHASVCCSHSFNLGNITLRVTEHLWCISLAPDEGKFTVHELLKAL